MLKVSQLCEYNRIHLILHFKRMNFLVCRFLSQKAQKKEEEENQSVVVKHTAQS